MAGGGKRPGAGRPKGARNKATVAKAEEIAATGLTPLDYMLGVLRSDEEPHERRQWAAQTAAPYVHPKLAQVEHGGKGGGLIQVVIAKEDEEL
jgi:hypothetical protein